MVTLVWTIYCALCEAVSTSGPLANEPVFSASLSTKPGLVSNRLLDSAKILLRPEGFVKP